MNATTKHDLSENTMICRWRYYLYTRIWPIATWHKHSWHAKHANSNLSQTRVVMMCIATYLLLQAPFSLGHVIKLRQTSPFWVAWFDHSSNQWCLLYFLAATINATTTYHSVFNTNRTFSHAWAPMWVRETKRLIIHNCLSRKLCFQPAVPIYERITLNIVSSVANFLICCHYTK